MERFRFDPQTLSYQKVKISQKLRIWRFLAFVGLTLIFSIALILIRDQQLNSPRAQNLEAFQQKVTYEL